MKATYWQLAAMWCPLERRLDPTIRSFIQNYKQLILKLDYLSTQMICHSTHLLFVNVTESILILGRFEAVHLSLLLSWIHHAHSHVVLYLEIWAMVVSVELVHWILLHTYILVAANKPADKGSVWEHCWIACWWGWLPLVSKGIATVLCCTICTIVIITNFMNLRLLTATLC